MSRLHHKNPLVIREHWTKCGTNTIEAAHYPCYYRAVNFAHLCIRVIHKLQCPCRLRLEDNTNQSLFSDLVPELRLTQHGPNLILRKITRPKERHPTIPRPRVPIYTPCIWNFVRLKYTVLIISWGLPHTHFRYRIIPKD